MREIALLEQQSLNQELQLEKAENQTRNLYIVSGLMFLIAILILTGLLSLRRSNRRLAESRRAIKTEKERSEHLLLNILPPSTADELKKNGKATPRRFENATVLFTDFKNFSQIASKMPPSELLEELHLFFSHFDAIVEKHRVEKIKTIGDAYMCVGGVPIATPDHAERVIDAAREVLAKTLELNQDQIRRGKTPWQLRLGINSGPVVAGVVGEKKFAFDIWGDTVNLAARMEQYGEVNTINISENTYELVKNNVPCAYRGEVEVHNRGPVKMYRVENPVQSAILKEM